MPTGSEVVSTAGRWATDWSQAGRIDVRLHDGHFVTFFIKLTRSREMVEGEFESMKALHNFDPVLVPQPLAFGTFESGAYWHFFLCEFVDLIIKPPDMKEFCRHLAGIHSRSMESNPDGKFGFHVTTCYGSIPQDNTWSTSWEAFFVNSLQKLFDMDINVNGLCEEYDELVPIVLEKVCPALLRPLETDGHSIKPCLIHGDLWDGNTAVHATFDTPRVFDAAASWSHNEYELAIWRAERVHFKRHYIYEYLKYIPRSAPDEDFEARQILYTVRCDLLDSILHKTCVDFRNPTSFRSLVIESMYRLAYNFEAGYQGTCERKDIALVKQQEELNIEKGAEGEEECAATDINDRDKAHP